MSIQSAKETFSTVLQHSLQLALAKEANKVLTTGISEVGIKAGLPEFIVNHEDTQKILRVGAPVVLRTLLEVLPEQSFSETLKEGCELALAGASEDVFEDILSMFLPTFQEISKYSSEITGDLEEEEELEEVFIEEGELS